VARARGRGRAIAVAAAIVAALVGGCGHPPSDHTTLSLSDNGRTIALAVGDTLDVELDTVGPFYFGTPIVSSTAVQFVRESDHFADPPNPGGGKTQRYSFEAGSAGYAEITIPRQTAQPDPPGFGITVQVF